VQLPDQMHRKIYISTKFVFQLPCDMAFINDSMSPKRNLDYFGPWANHDDGLPIEPSPKRL
jgi:hypothetical protein